MFLFYDLKIQLELCECIAPDVPNKRGGRTLLRKQVGARFKRSSQDRSDLYKSDVQSSMT